MSQTLDRHHPRTRQALGIVLSETAMLSACQETWNEYLEFISPIPAERDLSDEGDVSDGSSLAEGLGD